MPGLHLLHFEPSLDALSSRSDVTSSTINILSSSVVKSIFGTNPTQEGPGPYKAQPQLQNERAPCGPPALRSDKFPSVQSSGFVQRRFPPTPPPGTHREGLRAEDYSWNTDLIPVPYVQCILFRRLQRDRAGLVVFDPSKNCEEALVFQNPTKTRQNKCL